MIPGNGNPVIVCFSVAAQGSKLARWPNLGVNRYGVAEPNGKKWNQIAPWTDNR